jgi:hypothetical protein
MLFCRSLNSLRPKSKSPRKQIKNSTSRNVATVIILEPRTATISLADKEQINRSNISQKPKSKKRIKSSKIEYQSKSNIQNF